MRQATHDRQSGGIRKRPSVLLLIVLLLAAAALVFDLEALFFFPSGGAKELTLSEARGMENPVPDSPTVQAEAKALYLEHCAHCHGDTGAGDGGEAQMYTPPPADFTRPAMAGIRDGELFYRITVGRRPMPSFQRVLTDEQRWKLVRLIRTFAADTSRKTQD